MQRGDGAGELGLVESCYVTSCSPLVGAGPLVQPPPAPRQPHRRRLHQRGGRVHLRHHTAPARPLRVQPTGTKTFSKFEISETNTYNNSQAYHVTDSALSYFSPKQTGTLNVLRLQSCWEITNHGLVNIGQFNTADAVNNAMKVIHLHLSNFFSVHSLPNLTILSLSGCSKVTDDGIELIAENLRKLVSLDLSWCPRITDAALEYIACDLTHLEELTLDRSSNTSVTISRHKFSMGQDIQNI